MTSGPVDRVTDRSLVLELGQRVCEDMTAETTNHPALRLTEIEARALHAWTEALGHSVHRRRLVAA